MREPSYDIFLSYQRGSSRDWVKRELHERLQCRAYADGRTPSVFLDLEGILVGNTWSSVLATRIEACRHFLPVFTREYFESGMCRWELERAWSRDPSGYGGLILPVVRHATGADGIPFAYRGIQYESAFVAGWFERLCERLGLMTRSREERGELEIRLWIEPEASPAVSSRDISVVPKALTAQPFALGSGVRIGFQANRDCFVVLTDVGTTGRTSVVYPREARPFRCEGGMTHYFPSREDGERFILTGRRGLEIVRAFASPLPRTLEPAQLDGSGRPLDSKGWVDASCEFEIL